MCKETTENAIKFISSNAKRNNANFNSVFEHEGIIYACDGHQVLRTIEDIDESLLQNASSEMELWVDKLFEQKHNHSLDEFVLPDTSKFEEEISNLKRARKNASLTPKVLYKIRVGYAIADNIFLDAEYLLNAKQATGASKCYSAGKGTPFWFYGADTQYVLAPFCFVGKAKRGTMKAFG